MIRAKVKPSKLKAMDKTFHHLTLVSGNGKTGPIPVSTHDKKSCPDSCPLKEGGCYAKYAHLSWHWAKVSEGKSKKATDWLGFCSLISSLPKHQLWRYAQAGDLPGIGDDICKDSLMMLIKANKNKKGFTYTHKPTTKRNIELIQLANEKGFTVNLSANNIKQAIDYKRRFSGIPIVTLLPENAPNVQDRHGVKIVACPHEKNKSITCARCGLCQIKDRSYVIGFRVHGNGKKKAEKIALQNIA